jgi:pyruvate carboxylase
VRVLPTPTFFYGMQPGEEIQIEIEPGKTLVIQLLAVGDTHEDGEAKVFFELNGQPRDIFVPDRKAGATIQRRPKAKEGDPDHVPAPMPGLIASVAVKEGQKVAAGDLLLTIEAMKMETAIHADRAGVVKAIHAPVGAQVDAKDLLVEFEEG